MLSCCTTNTLFLLCKKSKTHGLFLGIGSLGLFSASKLLGTILTFLSLLPSSFFDCEQSLSYETVFRFEFLGGFQRVIDQGETSGSATTKSSLETKRKDILRCYCEAGIILRSSSDNTVYSVLQQKDIPRNQPCKLWPTFLELQPWTHWPCQDEGHPPPFVFWIKDG